MPKIDDGALVKGALKEISSLIASDPDLDTPDAYRYYEIVNRQRPLTLAMIRRLKPAQGDGSRRVSTTADGCPCVGNSYGAQSTMSLCAHHAEKVPLVGHALERTLPDVLEMNA